MQQVLSLHSVLCQQCQSLCFYSPSKSQSDHSFALNYPDIGNPTLITPWFSLLVQKGDWTCIQSVPLTQQRAGEQSRGDELGRLPNSFWKKGSRSGRSDACLLEQTWPVTWIGSACSSLSVTATMHVSFACPISELFIFYLMRLGTVENQQALTFSLSLAQADDPVLIFRTAVVTLASCKKHPHLLQSYFNWSCGHWVSVSQQSNARARETTSLLLHRFNKALIYSNKYQRKAVGLFIVIQHHYRNIWIRK